MTPYVSQHATMALAFAMAPVPVLVFIRGRLFHSDLKITSETFVHIVMAHLILKHLRPNRGGQDDWQTRPR